MTIRQRFQSIVEGRLNLAISNTQDKEGFALIELLIATAVVTMVMVAVASGVITSIRNSRYSREKTESVRIAQQQVEWLRQVRAVNGWSITESSFGEVIEEEGATNLVFCLDQVPSNSGLENLGQPTVQDNCLPNTDEYVTTIDVVGSQAGERLDFEINTQWLDGNTVRSTKVYSSLANWR